jgi:DNA-binding GntR family transcriptional regulator
MVDQYVSATREPAASADPAAEQIARVIERDIFRGRLRPGEKLREEELAERFGASRHHIREALLRLSRLGIVAKERNKGASVRQFTADELRQIYEVREILQRQAALRIKLPADPDAVARLKRLNEDYESAVEAGDFHLIHETNDRFHTELFGLCNNPLIVSLIFSRGQIHGRSRRSASTTSSSPRINISRSCVEESELERSPIDPGALWARLGSGVAGEAQHFDYRRSCLAASQGTAERPARRMEKSSEQAQSE